MSHDRRVATTSASKGRENNRSFLAAHLEFEARPQKIGFTAERCPRYKRLEAMCLERDWEELGLSPAGPAACDSKAMIDRATQKKAKELREAASKEDANLLQLVLECDSIRVLPASQCKLDEYVEALVVSRGRTMMTVGKCTPREGDTGVLYTAFLSEHDGGAAQASARAQLPRRTRPPRGSLSSAPSLARRAWRTRAPAAASSRT